MLPSLMVEGGRKNSLMGTLNLLLSVGWVDRRKSWKDAG